MDFDLTDEQRLIKDTAREFTDNEIVLQTRENARNHHFDLELVKKIADQGYLGCDRASGVRWRGPRLLQLRPDRRGDRPRRFGDPHGDLGADLAGLLGDPQVGQRGAEAQPTCRSSAPGSGSGCFGLTEPDTGSDAANQKTRAKKTDTGWVINGAKMWISMGNYARVALIFAQTDPELGYKGLACFLVDTDQPGFRASTIEHKMGLHASDTASIALEDVEVGEEAMLGQVGEGFKVAMSALDSGATRWRRDVWVSARAASRSRSTTPRSASSSDGRSPSFQLVQAMIADMVLKTDASRMLVWRAGWLKDKGRPNTLETSIAKLHATEASLECANLAIQVHGGAGYVDDHPVERYFRDARVTTLYEGTSQIQKLIIGREMTGIGALVPA